MRISTDPSDPAYIDDRPRRVWLNDREVTGWSVADEFRRCVITPDGVLNGAVLIERLSSDPGEPPKDFSAPSGVVPTIKLPNGNPDPTECFAITGNDEVAQRAANLSAKPAAMSAKKRKKAR